MAKAMKRLGVYLGFVDDDPNYDGYDRSTDSGAYGQRETHATVSHISAPVVTQHEPATVDVRTPVHPAPVAVSTQVAASTASAATVAPVDPYSIHTIHPRSYNEARRIGEEFRAGAPVIINLTEMDDTDAKRIVDFAAGLVFAIHGSMERITKKVFLLSPANVDVRDAPAVQQARDGFFNQS